MIKNNEKNTTSGPGLKAFVDGPGHGQSGSNLYIFYLGLSRKHLLQVKDTVFKAIVEWKGSMVTILKYTRIEVYKERIEKLL